MRVKFRISLFFGFLITAVVLFFNAYQVWWLEDPFTQTNSVSVSEDFSPISDKNRFSDAIATNISMSILNKEFEKFRGQQFCVEAFGIQEENYNPVPIISVNAETQLIPASVMKYITAVVVLETFDPQSRLNTELIASANTPRLTKAWLRTTGDPSFVSTLGDVPRRPSFLTPESARTFSDLAENIYRSGVRFIGNLEIETSWFKIPAVESGWSSDRSFVGQLAALNVDEGFENNVLAENADVYSAELLKAVLINRGIEVGEISYGSIPESETNVIASTQSASMINLVTDMLSTSNNVYAEQLLAAATRTKYSEVTLDTRSDYVHEVINGLLKTESNTFTFANASGYTRNAKISCSVVNNVIKTFFIESGIDVTQLAAVAGERGTLNERFNSLEQTLEAKTGTLNGVTALSGEISDSILFSFIANGSFTQDQGFSLQQEAVRPLAEFPTIRNLEL